MDDAFNVRQVLVRPFAVPPETIRTVMVTGGAGFIGSAFLRLLVPAFPNVRFINVDCLSYAGHIDNVAVLSKRDNYAFVNLDLTDAAGTNELVSDLRPDWVFHLAAETHVDRSIHDPVRTATANFNGTLNLLESLRLTWLKGQGLFLQVSTDEVYGSLGADSKFTSTSPYDPSSPYSASKAAADHMVRAYGRTYDMPVMVTNCTNNYGPRQYPEKLIPFVILQALKKESIPVYGDGSNVREWLHVDDHVEALWTVANAGHIGSTYLVGSGEESSNLQVVHEICRSLSDILNRPEAELRALIQFVTDRPGHDFRYAVDSTPIRKQLGWRPRVTLREGIYDAVQWYLNNTAWLDKVTGTSFSEWVERNYSTPVNP